MFIVLAAHKKPYLLQDYAADRAFSFLFYKLTFIFHAVLIEQIGNPQVLLIVA